MREGEKSGPTDAELIMLEGEEALELQGLLTFCLWNNMPLSGPQNTRFKRPHTFRNAVFENTLF